MIKGKFLHSYTHTDIATLKSCMVNMVKLLFKWRWKKKIVNMNFPVSSSRAKL